MRHKTWEKVEQVFHTAMELSVAERTPYLQRECADAPELLSEVESLISSFENDSDFLDEPVFEIGLGAIGKKSQKNLAGETIGFYQLVEKIGAGGMGEVYLAIDRRLNRRVALKFLSESLENDNAAKRQFVKEAQAVAMLEHPNICAIHSIEQTDEHQFIVMQYIEGRTLADIINKKDDKKTVGVQEFKVLTRQIVTAVAFAHSHGVIHRDLKPGNIMLTDEGQIKVLDFGLAKVIPQNHFLGRETSGESSRFSSNEAVIGTVSYMSPEQLRGKKNDFRSDIFSVGIVLYELLAQKNPFNYKSQAETIAAILTDEPPALKEIAPDFPENLINLVEKCLQKKPELRFQSAAEILVELDTTESANVAKSNLKRRQNFFVKAVLAVIALIVVFAAGYFFYNRAPSRKTLAVLPISFPNPPDGKEYLADGLTQSIIDKLSNLSDLKVKSELLTARYKGKAIEVQTIGKELNVDAIYVGSIQSRGADLFLVAKLFRTTDGLVLDSNELEIEETNLIELPEDISKRIIGTVKSNLTDEEKIKIAKKDTESEEAKRRYDLGRFYLKRKKEGNDIETAIQYFSDAKDLDQKFAKAWAGLAEAYLASSLPGVKRAIPPKIAVGYAKLAADKAVELDNTICESYNSLGLISAKYEWKWTEAEGYFRTAINLNPEFISAHIGLIGVFNAQGRFDESIEEAKKIKEVDPLSFASDIELAKIYYRKQDYEQTDKILANLLERFPENKNIRYIQCYLFLKTGRLKEATEILEGMYNSNNEEDKVFAAAPLGFAYAKLGRGKDALKIINNLDKFAENNYVPSQEKAIIYVGLGDFDKAFENLNKSCDEKFPTLPGLLSDPIVEDLKTDSRFAKIKECIKLSG